jgi:pimeloyl-ACP methyl ester carboxylesterase
MQPRYRDWSLTVKTLPKFGVLSAILSVAMAAAVAAHAEPDPRPAATATASHHATRARAPDVSDAALVKTLPGFKNGYADVNGVRLHYVIGGTGAPLVLLPGWPETWWAFHKMLPALAEHYTVIDVDLRGMGGSSRPADGYDKKSMARDIRELVQSLGYDRVDIAGHDIGSAVAFAYAASYPQATSKLVMMELPHPDDSLLTFPLVVPPGTNFGDKLEVGHPFLWWFAFNQVKGLPEQILQGHVRAEQDWLFKYLLVDEGAIDARDRAVYERAYDSAEAIRASNAWYQTFGQDILDYRAYGKVDVPVLALGGPAYRWMKKVVPAKATNLTTVDVEHSGHFIQEEQPEFVTKAVLDFLQDQQHHDASSS